MSILKKEVSTLWVRGEAVVALFSSGISFGLSYMYLFGDFGALYTLSAFLLLLGLGNALALVTINRFKLPKEDLYSPLFIPIAKTLAILMFLSFSLHIFIELGALATG